MLEPTHSLAQLTQLRRGNRFMKEAEDDNTQQTVQQAEQSLLFETSNIREQIV